MTISVATILMDRSSPVSPASVPTMSIEDCAA
jgi:hypothetical protein